MWYKTKKGGGGTTMLKIRTSTSVPLVKRKFRIICRKRARVRFVPLKISPDNSDCTPLFASQCGLSWRGSGRLSSFLLSHHYRPPYDAPLVNGEAIRWASVREQPPRAKCAHNRANCTKRRLVTTLSTDIPIKSPGLSSIQEA